ncbi:hypothetical protein ACRALDRAFT_2054766 [Sodiomyces alcalophilus JCM 7366]|uniref:uncharacterized protein n=1 Tax=Sodiomyces alcalophilus JCM 7366 TaxID=591952 RepID=UPI0039B398AD
MGHMKDLMAQEQATDHAKINIGTVIEQFKAEMKAEMTAFKTEMKAEMTTFKTEMKAEMTTFKTDVLRMISEMNAELTKMNSTMHTAMAKMQSNMSADIAKEFYRFYYRAFFAFVTGTVVLLFAAISVQYSQSMKLDMEIEKAALKNARINEVLKAALQPAAPPLAGAALAETDQ